MAGSADTPARRWTAAAAVAAAAIALMLALVRPPKPPAVSGGPQALAPRIVLARNLTGEAALLDPAPLFLPTDRNGSPGVPAAPEPGGGFSGYRVSLPEGSLTPNLGQPIAVPAGPAEALTVQPPGNPVLGIGRTSELGSIPHLSARKSFVEISDLATGLPVAALSVADAQPPEPFGPDRRPIEYVAAVEPMGLVGAPATSVSSGSPALDAYFADFLARSLHLGERLHPGIYRICVGP